MSDKKNIKTKKANDKPNGFVRFFKGIGSKLKGMWSELKKVSWPTFAKVLKNTGIVLAVVLIFGAVIFGMDFGLGKLLELLKIKVSGEGTTSALKNLFLF